MTKIRAEIKRGNEELELKLKLELEQKMQAMLRAARLSPENQRLFPPVRCVGVDYEEEDPWDADYEG